MPKGDLADRGTLTDIQRQIGIPWSMLWRCAQEPWFPKPMDFKGIKLYKASEVAVAMGVPLHKEP